jgi:uncharacterized protein (TIGR02145 family)
MKTKTLLSILAFTITLNVIGQNTIGLTFTAENNVEYVQLDSIKITDFHQFDTVIYWPDTTLFVEIDQYSWSLIYVGYATISTVGTPKANDDILSFSVYQNYPNPMHDQSMISMNIPEKGRVDMIISDLHGRVVLSANRQLDAGRHSFRFYPGDGNIFFLTAHWNGVSRSIRMISTGQQNGKNCRLDYVGTQSVNAVLKNTFEVDDSNVLQSGIKDYPQQNTAYTFQFATNIPCPGTPTVEYEGQVYNTIQIFSQCWLKENLNVGTMIMGNEYPTDNGIIEKYCYNNEPDSCTKYGGLYLWLEMLQYSEDSQGICPPGWRVPDDWDWCLLGGAVDSQYGIEDPEWYDWWFSSFGGYDAGTNLKATSGWNENSVGTDMFGFSGLPGGYLNTGTGNFSDAHKYGFWWSSTYYHDDDVLGRILGFDSQQVKRSYYMYHARAASVRCIRDD